MRKQGTELAHTFLTFTFFRVDDVRVVVAFLDETFLVRFALASLMNLLNNSCSFFVKGLLLITKSTPSGSLISPIILFFKVFVN